MQAYFNLGLAFKVMERADDSIDMYQRALSLTKGSDSEMVAHISNELAVAYVIQGNLPRAAETFASAVRYQPGNVEYRKNLGHALRQMGRTEAAAAEFRNVLRIRPDDPDARALLQELAGSQPGAR